MRLPAALLLALFGLTACSPVLRNTGPGEVEDDDDAQDDDDLANDDDDIAWDDDDDTPTPDDDDSWDDDDDDAWDDDDDSWGDDDDAWDDDDIDPEGCDGPESLVLGAWVFDTDGNAGSTFSTTDELTLEAWVSNPCDVPIVFTTSSSCLVDPWSLEAASGLGIGRGCDDAETDWWIDAGGTLYDTEFWGTMDTDDYFWSIGFFDQWLETWFEVL